MKAGLIFKQVPFAVQCTIYQQNCFLDPTVEESGPSATHVFVREPAKHVIQNGAIKTAEKGFREFTQILENWPARGAPVDAEAITRTAREVLDWLVEDAVRV